MEAITADQVSGVTVDDVAPAYGRNADGYGRKIPTRYRLTCKRDGRTRRVYMVQLSNSGSPFVVIEGRRHFLAPSVEALIENPADRRY